MSSPAPRGQELAAARQDWTRQLHSHGRRLTVQRQLVLEALAGLRRGTPEDITAAVQRTVSSVSVSTVYRSLELLELLGVVRHAHVGHGAPVYSLASDEPRLLLVCTSCAGVVDTRSTPLRPVVEHVLRAHGFAVDVGHVSLAGLCGPCSSSTAVVGGPRQAEQPARS